ncbi:hypothetical protein Tco_1547016 [Tanacetum coccineum]
MSTFLINWLRLGQWTTLIEATRTMLIFSKLPEFLWGEALSIACFTQNRSFIHIRTQEVTDNSAANTLDNEDTPSSSSIIVEDNDASQIVTSSKEQIKQEPLTPVLNSHSDEQIQEEDVELDENTLMNLFRTPNFEEAESSSNYQVPSNMHEFHQKHRYTDKLTKNHPIKQVIGDPSKPVTTRSKLQFDA